MKEYHRLNDYRVGSIIQHRPPSGKLRTIKITRRLKNVRPGRGPGFEGRELRPRLLTPVSNLKFDSWGYDDSIKKIVRY